MLFRVDNQILQAVRQLVEGNEELLAAVAFWGRGAGQQTGITERTAPTKVLCDLLSGSCNPTEVRHLLENNIQVKYRPHLHAKVWMSGNEVVVGSANASMNGLGFEAAGSNIEAAVYLRDKKTAGNVRKWFEREWHLAEDIDDILLLTAEAIWNQRQNTRWAIMRCFIVAYMNDTLSEDAMTIFDQIAQDHYDEQQWNEIQADALEYETHAANITCYELGSDDTPPPVGTVYMDYAHYQDGADFTFGGFWEVLHSEPIQENGHTLCLLAKRGGQKYRAPAGCGNRQGIDAMVNCYLNRENRDNLEMDFGAFYFLQQERYCNNAQDRCGSCPFAIVDG